LKIRVSVVQIRLRAPFYFSKIKMLWCGRLPGVQAPNALGFHSGCQVAHWNDVNFCWVALTLGNGTALNIDLRMWLFLFPAAMFART
jgi:hypothetical protein